MNNTRKIIVNLASKGLLSPSESEILENEICEAEEIISESKRVYAVANNAITNSIEI